MRIRCVAALIIFDDFAPALARLYEHYWVIVSAENPNGDVSRRPRSSAGAIPRTSYMARDRTLPLSAIESADKRTMIRAECCRCNMAADE